MNKQKAATCPLKSTRTTAQGQAVARRIKTSVHAAPALLALTKPQTGEHTPRVRLGPYPARADLSEPLTCNTE